MKNYYIFFPRSQFLAYPGFPYARLFLESPQSRELVSALGRILKTDGSGEYANFSNADYIYKLFLKGKLTQKNSAEFTNRPYYAQFYYTAKKYGHDDLPEPDIDNLIDEGAGGIIYRAMLDAGYIDEAFLSLSQHMDSRTNIIPFIDYIVNKDDIKLGYKLLDMVSKNDKEWVINQFCTKGYSGSMVFEQAYPNFSYKVSDFNSTRDLITKSNYDFEGLYRLSEFVKHKRYVRDISVNIANKYEPTIIEIFE